MRRTIATVTGLAFVVAGCSGGGSDGDSAAGSPTTERPSGTSEPPATTIDAATPTTASPTTTTASSTTTTASSTTTAIVPATTDGAAATSTVASTAPSSDESARDFSAIGPIVTDFVAEQGLNGAGLVVVDREDGIVHEEYWGEFDRGRVSFLASSSKMITAGVLLRLHDQGVLDLDAPVAAVADWGAGNPAITPAQLVSNSSGLVGLNPNPFYGPYVCQWSPVGDLEDCGAAIMTTPDDDADVVPPDTEFRYGGAQWQVAGAVAEAASGKTWATLIDETYVEPCGVDSLRYGNHFVEQISLGYPSGLDPTELTPTDNPNMEAGAVIDPPDYAALLTMLLRDGECDGGRVLTAASVERMLSDRIGEAYGGAANGDPDSGYGMGWWLWRPNGMLTDPGLYGAVPWLDVADGYGAYLVIEDSNNAGVELYLALEDIVDAAMSAG